MKITPICGEGGGKVILKVGMKSLATSNDEILVF